MAIDFDMMSVVVYCLPDAKHNKKESVAIENAYLAESVRAKLYGNDSFGDVAHVVYEKFEGKIIPEEFVGSAQYVNNFIKGSFGENNLVYALSDKISEKEVADGYLLDTEGLSDWELDTYPIYDVDKQSTGDDDFDK